MSTDIENTVKDCTMCVDYQEIQIHEKTLPHQLLTKSWEIAGVDIFLIMNHCCAL